MIQEIINDIIQDRSLRGHSTRWANWEASLTPTTCKFCVEKHGTIVAIDILAHKSEVEAHPNCKCVYVPMRTKVAGTATLDGVNGADFLVFYFAKLPENYITFQDARKKGWVVNKGNLDKVLPNHSIGGDIYKNKDNKLPQIPGRIWFEADINYSGGFRNRQRLLYSNDGLVFVSYDHYHTFYEITN